MNIDILSEDLLGMFQDYVNSMTPFANKKHNVQAAHMEKEIKLITTRSTQQCQNEKQRRKYDEIKTKTG